MIKIINTKLLILPILIWLSVLITWCTSIISESNNKDTNPVWTKNPASVYCEENGGRLELIFDNWETYGLCYFPNWKVCEERDFYNKKCSPDNTNETESTWDTENNQENVVCPEDVKECPDGSYVSRNWPNCEFDICPTQNDNDITTTWNIEENITTWEILNEEELDKDDKNNIWYQKTTLTEEDIDLMEEIIEKLK